MVNLLIQLFEHSGYFSPASISDCKQAIDTGQKLKFRQGLLVKHIQDLAKTSHGSEHFTMVGRVGNDQSIVDCISVVEKTQCHKINSHEINCH